MPHDDDVAVVLMGSWGRAEVTAGSDYDFIVLVRGADREDARPSIKDVATVLDQAPGDQGTFGNAVGSDLLIREIGLDEDTNKNLSRRMLLLLESVATTHEDIHDSVVTELLQRYLDESVKHFRVPRFLLNDVVRYWRTICVDFAGKERRGPEKWGIRNAKLRTSRKTLFAGGLLPVFECAKLARDEMPRFLRRQFRMPPTDRIAHAFLAHPAPDPGGRALGAYDDFVGRMDDKAFRDELTDVTRDSSKDSQAFQEPLGSGRSWSGDSSPYYSKPNPSRSSRATTSSSDQYVFVIGRPHGGISRNRGCRRNRVPNRVPNLANLTPASLIQLAVLEPNRP